jgi:hypothetical protein
MTGDQEPTPEDIAEGKRLLAALEATERLQLERGFFERARTSGEIEWPPAKQTRRA